MPIYAFLKGLNKKQFTPIDFVLIGLILISIISLVLNLGALNLDRVLSAFFNIVCWATLYFSFRAASVLNVKLLAKALFALLLALFAVYIIGKSVSLSSMSVNTMAWYLFGEGMPTMLDFYIQRRLLVPDYFGELTVRFTGFGPYANAAAAIVMVVVIIILGMQRNILKSAAISLLGLVMVFETHSRASVLVFLAVLIFFQLMQWRHALKSLVMLIVIIPILGLSNVDYARQVWGKFNDVRGSSSDTRFANYALAWGDVLNNKSVYGYGARGKTSKFNISIGSHSTITGIVYKTGLLGLGAYLLLLFLVTKRIFYLILYRERVFQYRRVLSYMSTFLVITIWSIYEDVDVSPLLCLFYGVAIGLIDSNYMLIKSRPNESGLYVFSK